jgi:hypothetical protein
VGESRCTRYFRRTAHDILARAPELRAESIEIPSGSLFALISHSNTIVHIPPEYLTYIVGDYNRFVEELETDT